MDWQHMIKAVTPRWGWALTGSGHFFNECIEIARQLEHVDLLRQQSRRGSAAPI
jgi:flavoprotein